MASEEVSNRPIPATIWSVISLIVNVGNGSKLSNRAAAAIISSHRRSISSLVVSAIVRRTFWQCRNLDREASKLTSSVGGGVSGEDDLLVEE